RHAAVAAVVTIRNISDTALWAAIYRADETARPDALFRDPLAARLAGERARDSRSAAETRATRVAVGDAHGALRSIHHGRRQERRGSRAQPRGRARHAAVPDGAAGSAAVDRSRSAGFARLQGRSAQ